jgi:uncharacterized membrane protein YphA (DoxX/SURF4 family)
MWTIEQGNLAMLNLHPYFLLCLRILLATIFLYYGLGKLKSLSSFITAVMAYRLIPTTLAQPFALTLVAIEIVLGVLLLFGWYTRMSAAVGGVLMLIFIMAMAINISHGNTDLDCGCSGGHTRQIIGTKTIVRNIAIFVAAIYVYWVGGGIFSIDSLSLETKSILFENILLPILFPIALSVMGLILVGKLIKATIRLSTLIPVERTLKGHTPNLQSAQLEKAGIRK